MNKQNYDSSLHSARVMARNLVGALVVLSIAIATLIFINVVMLSRKQTVLIPATLTGPVSFEGVRYSEEYYGQMARWFAFLALNYTPASYDYTAKEFLRYADPSSYATLKAMLAQEGEQIKRRGWSSAFFANGVIVKGRNVAVQGVQRTYVGQLLTDEKKMSWIVQFGSLPSGEVRVLSFKEADFKDPFNPDKKVASLN